MGDETKVVDLPPAKSGADVIAKGMITPRLPKKRAFPKVQIAVCCESDEYLCVKINGVWQELFITKLSEDEVKKVATFTVRSRDVPTGKCRLCQEELEKGKTRPYHFGDSEALDDNFMDTARRLEQRVKEGTQPSVEAQQKKSSTP